MDRVALFTDVSLNPKLKIGAGAYLIVPASFLEVSPISVEESEVTNRLVIKRFESASSTTLEVQTALWAIEDYRNGLDLLESGKLQVYSDSQCVAGLLGRRPGLEAKGFLAKRTNCQLKNACLYRRFYKLYDELEFEIIKVTGHIRSCSHDTVHRIFSFVDKNVRKTMNLWMREFEFGSKEKYLKTQ
jgi:ribonuclease HI